MLYLTVPLSIIAFSLMAIMVIVWRKHSYLRRLEPESHETGRSLLHDFAPEAVDWYRGIPWQQYTQHLLSELEKLLRRGRLLMGVMDRASERMVRKVRRAHQETAKQVALHEEARQEAQAEEEEEEDDVDMGDPEQLKQEEQRLIVAIAQDPKDASLYHDLARISMRLGAFGDAIEALEQALKLDTGNEHYRKLLERAKRKKAAAAN